MKSPKLWTCILLSLSAVHCQPKKAPNTLGPETPLLEVQKAISAPLEGLTPLNIQYGDKVLTNDHFTLASNPVVVTADNLTEVFERDETDEAIYISMLETTQTYKDNTRESSNRKHHEFGLSKKPKETNADPATAPEGITFHNLTITPIRLAPPVAVKAQPGCLGIPNCQLDATIVSVDKVIWNPDKYDKIHMEWVLSKQVPYMAAVLSLCSSLVTVLEIKPGEKMPLYLRSCSDVVDFRFGKPLTMSQFMRPHDVIVEDWPNIDPLARLGRWMMLGKAQDHVPPVLRVHE